MRTSYLLNGAVGERMCGHVKQQEVLFLCGQDTFLHQVLCEALPDVSQLVVQLQGIPGLSWKMDGGLGHEGHQPGGHFTAIGQPSHR